MNHNPKRPRKLLLHRREIDKLGAKAARAGPDPRPAQIYFKKGMAKVEICDRQGPQDLRQARGAQEAGRQARHRPGPAPDES